MLYMQYFCEWNLCDVCVQLPFLFVRTRAHQNWQYFYVIKYFSLMRVCGSDLNWFMCLRKMDKLGCVARISTNKQYRNLWCDHVFRCCCVEWHWTKGGPAAIRIRSACYCVYYICTPIHFILHVSFCCFFFFSLIQFFYNKSWTHTHTPNCTRMKRNWTLCAFVRQHTGVFRCAVLKKSRMGAC